MQNDVSKPARPDAHPGAAGDRNDRFGRTTCSLFGWVVALALSACGGGGSDVAPPAAGASAPPAAASGVTVSGPDGASLFIPDGATATPVTFRIAKDSTGATPLPSVVVPAGDVYAITPSGTELQGMVTVQVPVDPQTPAEATLALAQADADDIWTIHPRAVRRGATLELEVARLGLFRVVRLDGVGAQAAAAGRARPLASNSVGGIRLLADRFAVNGSLFENPTPYPTATLVAVTAEPYNAPRASSVCPEAERIVVFQHGLTETPPFRSLPLLNELTDVNPPSPGPWTFTLRVHRLPQTKADMYVNVYAVCRDASGRRYLFGADEQMHYQVADPSALAFFMSPADAAVTAGESASFSVRVIGGPARPAISSRDQYRLFWERSDDGGAVWRTIGSAYQSDARDPNFDATTLGWRHAITVPTVTASDNGALIRGRGCYAPPGSVEACVTSGAARLTVAHSSAPPLITQQPRSLETLVGETANFTIAVAGVPGPHIQWQVQQTVTAGWLDVGSAGANWPGAIPNALTLVTPTGTPDANGWLFRAVVANAAGSITSDAVVWRISQAPVAPAITVQPASTSASLGATALFAAAAEGTAPLSYQWSKDGAPVAGATSPVLALVNVQPADLASYRLTVSGPGGSATSNAATLSAGQGPTPPTPPLVSMQPAPATVPQGMAATFRVAVTGSPAPACQWTRNGIVIPGAASCGSYTTPPATAADNGAVYNVVVSNAGGTAIGGGAVLTVQGLASAGSWTFLPTGTGENLYDVTIIGGDPKQVVAVGQQGSILRSTDGGVSWTRVHVALSTMYRVRFVDANVGVAVGINNIARTVDGGATWETVWYAPNEQAAYGAQSLHSINWVDANTAIAIGFSRVWRSIDRGATWSVYGSHDFAALGAQIRFLQFGSGGLGLAGGDYRLFRTTDGGLTWNEVALPLNPYMNGLVVGSTGQDWVMVGANGIHRSSDGGLTWAAAASAGYLIGVVAHGNRMTAVGDAGLVMNSSDDGATWTTGPIVPFGQLWGVDFAGQTTFVSGSGGVVARHD